jgi:hypothetical protein
MPGVFMKIKRGTAILLVVALLLASSAVAVNVLVDDEVPTEAGELSMNAGAGEVGVDVLPPSVEDKMLEENLE